MQSRNDQIDAGAGKHFTSHVSVPARPNGHAVVVLHEIFGVTSTIRAVADRFAEDGYLAFAPDLFWRVRPGIELTHSKEDMGKAFGLLASYIDADGLSDISIVVRHIRALPGWDGKVAIAGMCLGGKLAYLAAVSGNADACVGFYGVGIESHLSLAGALRCPLLLHFGDCDKYVPAGARRQIADALAGASQASIVEYPGADHGFYTRGSAGDIALARQRTNEFLHRSLESSQR